MASARRTGTNEAISTYGAGQDYTVLATWEAATDNDNVATTTSPTLTCLAAEYDDEIVMDGSVNNSIYFRGIRPQASNFHTGIRDTGVRFYSTQDSIVGVIRVNETDVQIQDLVAKTTINSAGTQSTFALSALADRVGFIGCIAVNGQNAGAGTINGFNFATDLVSYAVNCLSENNENRNFETGSSGTHHWLNCTSINAGDQGFHREVFTAGTVRNCLAQEAAGTCFGGSFGGSTTEFNASSDATAPGTDSRTSQTFTFVNAGANDYHLTSADAGARGFGTSLSADANYAFDDDIDRQSWVGLWSMGFDEYTPTATKFAFAHGAIQWLTSDALNTIYTVNSLTFTPKALRFYWMGLQSSTDAASEAVHQRRGVGFATSTSDRRVVATQDQDAAVTSICVSGYREDAVAMTITSTPAVDGLLDLSVITSDGFRLIVDDVVPANITVFWEAWGGSDILNAATGEIAEPAATGLASYTVTGSFQPSVIMLAGIQGTGAAPVAARTDSGLFVGASTGAGQNIVVTGNSDDNSGSLDTDGYCRGDECLAQIVLAGGNPNARASLTNFESNGFTLNWAARATTSRRSIYLAIRGGHWRAGAYTIAGNSASSTATVSGLPFTPVGLSLMGRMTIESTSATATANDRIGLGSGTSTSSRRSQGMLSENATASSNTEIDTVVEYDQVLAYPSTAGALLTAYDINAMNADGFQIITDVAGGVASEWHGYLTFGPKVSSPLFSRQCRPQFYPHPIPRRSR